MAFFVRVTRTGVSIFTDDPARQPAAVSRQTPARHARMITWPLTLWIFESAETSQFGPTRIKNRKQLKFELDSIQNKLSAFSYVLPAGHLKAHVSAGGGVSIAKHGTNPHPFLSS